MDSPGIGPFRCSTWEIQQLWPVTVTSWRRHPRRTKNTPPPPPLSSETKRTCAAAPIVLASSLMLRCMRRLENTPSLNYVMTYFSSMPSEHCGLNCTAGKKKKRDIAVSGAPFSFFFFFFLVLCFILAFFGISPFCHGNIFFFCNMLSLSSFANPLVHSLFFLSIRSTAVAAFPFEFIPVALRSKADLRPGWVASYIAAVPQSQS